LRNMLSRPPVSEEVPVMYELHGVRIADPYRWLEDQNSSQTRKWVHAQTTYARGYLDSIPGRDRIWHRIRELLEVETCDSLIATSGQYFFRKRSPQEEQAGIYVRDKVNGPDRMLVDPSKLGLDKYTAAKPVAVSQDGALLAYELRQGGQRSGVVEILEVCSGRRLAARGGSQ